MAILIAIIRYIINNINEFIFIILEYALNTSKVNIILLSSAILLIIFITIYSIIFLLIYISLNFF